MNLFITDMTKTVAWTYCFSCCRYCCYTVMVFSVYIFSVSYSSSSLPIVVVLDEFVIAQLLAFHCRLGVTFLIYV